MVKIRKFKKRLGIRRMKSRGAGRMMRKGRRKMNRRLPSMRLNRFSKFRKKYIKKKKYGRKSKGRQSFKRTFSKYKRGVVGASRNNRNPRKLHKLKLNVKTLLGSFNEIVCDYFVNTKLAYVNEVPRTEFQKRLASRAHVMDDLAKSNPGELFKGDNSTYGIDSSCINPPIKFEKTTVSFQGHSDMSPMLSLFTPLNCSFKAINALSAVIGLTVAECVSLVDIILSSTMCFQSAVVENVGNVQRTYTIKPLIWFLNNDSQYFTAADTKTYVDIHFHTLVAAFLFGTGFNNTQKFVNPKYLMMYKIQTANGQINVVHGTHQFSQIYDSAGDLRTNVKLHATSTIHQSILVGQIFNHDTVASPTTPIDAANWDASNGFSGAFSCVSLVDPDTRELFINFMADMIVYTELKFGRGQRYDSNNVSWIIRPVNLDSACGLYFLELLNKENASVTQFINLDQLQSKGLVRLRLLSKKTLTYVPKYEANAHFLFVPKGVTATVKTEYNRDYSGFMNLFSTIEKSNVLREKLTDYGKQFYRKLEPSYNLSII